MSGAQDDTSTAPADQQSASAAAPDPRAWLPEEYRGDKAFEPFKDVAALAKSYRDTVKFVGADKATLLRLPKDEAAPEWGDVWAKLGRPETPEGYTFEGVDDLPGLDAFRAAAHSAGLSGKQAQAAVQWYAEHQGKQREEMRASTERELRQEWGAAYDERLHAAKKIVEQVGGQEMLDFVERSGFGNHPSVIKLFAKLAAEVAEPGALKGGGSGQQPGAGNLSPAEAQAEIAQLRNDRAFMDRYFARDTEAVKRLSQLYDMAHPKGT